jgi:serine/threonine-protein kinase
MGTVWLADRVDGTLKRKVALKLPHQGLSGPFLAQRLARERDILAALDHPNIARIYDAGVAEDGQPFLALEYVEGTPIDSFCVEHALSLQGRLELFGQVCRAVAHAHAHLVLHRDLKPSNILVTTDGQVRLLDFGVAKLLQENAPAPETELTQLGGRVLTPEYASPEQISGQPLTTASDVYSLGVVLYELLTGQRPYRVTRKSMSALEEAILTTEPLRPSRVVRSEMRRLLAGDLDTIVLVALRKSPTARYRTVSALLDDIERSRTARPVLARSDSTWYRMQKFVRRHRVLVSASGAVLLAVLLGAGAALWQARRARLEAARAEASAAEARFEASVARANHEFLGQIFGDAMRGGETDAMRVRLDRAREGLRRQYVNHPVVHALLLLELGARYEELDLPERVADVVKEYAALARKTGEPALLAILECSDGYDALTGRDLEKGRDLVARGLELMARARRARTEAGLECFRADAMLAMKSGDPERAVQRSKELLRLLEEDGLGQSRMYLSSLSWLGYLYSMAGNYAQALETSRRKTALEESLGSDETISAYVERYNAGQYLFGLGRITETESLNERLRADFERTGSGKLPSDIVVAWARNAVVANDLAEARHLLDSLASTLEKTPSPPNSLATHLVLADVDLRSNRLAEAWSELARAEAVARTSSASPRWQLHGSRVRLALAERQADHAAVRRELESLQALLDSIPDPVRTIVPVRTTVLEAELEAGRALLLEGEMAAAGGYASRSLALARSAVLPGKTSAWVGAAELLQARVELASGRSDQGWTLARDAEHELADTLSPTHPFRLEATALAQGLGPPAR